MIAEVYPIKRMPRRFTVFDYEIPDGMSLSRGSGVRIPFRFGELRGIVARLSDGSERTRALKSITSVLPDLTLSDAELSCVEDAAFDAAQSVSAILHAVIPVPSSRDRAKPSDRPLPPAALTISAREAPGISETVAALSERDEAFVSVSDLKRATVLIATYRRANPGAPILVLAPNVRDARLVGSRLAGPGTVVVTGEESSAERFRRWRRWRELPAGLLVGSRVAALWTHPRLHAVFLVRSGHPNHKQADRNPRMDTRIVARILRQRLGARRYHLDVVPGTEDLFRLGAPNLIGSAERPETVIADMTIERDGSPHPCLGNSLVMEVTRALSEGRRVVCSYNRKGVSRRLQCADCKHRFPCPECGGVLAPYPSAVLCHRCGHAEPLPTSCPSCQKRNLTPKGFGNRAVAAAIQAEFPEATVACLDRDTRVDGSEDADILVVTRHYLENVFDPFHPPDVGLVAELDGDRSLFEPSQRAVEKALYNAEEWRGVAHACRARFLIQTEIPDLFRSALSSPEKTLLDDLSVRKSYGQPPYVRALSVDAKADDEASRKEMLAEASRVVRSASPGAEIIEGETVVARVPPEDELAVLKAFSSMDDRYIIDTSPAD